jgi:hypothetical protein
MPKLRETKDAYYIEPTLAEQLIPVLGSVFQALQQRTEEGKRKRKEIQAADDAAADLRVKLADLAKTDPEKANELQSMDAVRRILDPNLRTRLQHEDERPITRLMHRGEHKQLQAAPVPAPKPFEASPQLKAARLKADEEVKRAESESKKAGAEADLAVERSKRLLDAKPGDTIKELMVLSGGTSLPSAEQIASYMSGGKTALGSAQAKVPYTPEWIAEKSSGEANNLLKEFPDADPKDLMTYARSIFDPNTTLDAETRKRLGKSASAQKMDLDERTLKVREGELGVSRNRLRQDRLEKESSMAQFILDNSGGTIETSFAVEAAQKWFETGKLPEDLQLPTDKKKEADLLYTQAQTARVNEEVERARIKSPKFDALIEAARVEPDETKKAAMVSAATQEMCKNAGPESPWCGLDKGKQGLTNQAIALKQAMDAYIGNLALRGAVKGAAMGAGAIRGTVHTALNPLEGVKGPSIMPRPGAAPMPSMYTPEVEALVTKTVEGLEKLLQDPTLDEATRKEIGLKSKEIEEALRTGNYEAIFKLWQPKQ